MSLHTTVNVSIPRCVIGKQIFVPQPAELITAVARLAAFVNQVLPSRVKDFDRLIKGISLLNRFIHIKLPAKLIQRG